MTLTIRSPARRDMGKPDVPVAGRRAPVAIVIQIFVTDDIVRHISGRPRILVAMITAVAPVVEVVRSADIFNLGI